MKRKMLIFGVIVLFCIFLANSSTYALTEENDIDEKVIEEGYYIFQSALDKSKVLDLNGISKNCEENIQLWSGNGGANQIFEIVYNKATKSYIIKSAFSGKVLDLAWAGKNNGTNVQVYNYSNVEWQRWKIEKTSDGYYSIKSEYSGLYLDATGNKSDNGTNIEVYSWNNGLNQKFNLEKVEIPKQVSNVDEGFYQIAPSTNQDMVFDILGAYKTDRAQLGVWGNSLQANQKFKVIKNSNGYYNIVNLNSDLYLEADGMDIRQRNKDNETLAQDWVLEKSENGIYIIISRCGGLALTYNGQNGLTMSGKNESNNQKFYFYKSANLKGKQTIPDGYYIIEPNVSQDKAIDISDASIYSEANVILWGKSYRNNQKFKFTYDGDGYYTITSVRSNKVLDVAWAGKENESNVQQYSNSGNKWQKWMVEKNSDGSYCLISAYNGLYIDLPYGKAENGNNIQLYSYNGGNNQKFLLEETTAVESKRTIEDGYYKIQSGLNENLTIDVPDFSRESNIGVGLWSNNNGYNQRYKITCRENGYYTIVAVHSKKAIGVEGEEVKQKNTEFPEEQEWAINKMSDGSYCIVSAHNGLYLNVLGSGEKGNQINISEKNNNKNQKFILKKTTVENGSQTVSNGNYQILTGLDENRVLDIEGAASYSGANLEIWTNNKQNNQKFRVEYKENGHYKIYAINSGKPIGVEDPGEGETVNVRQYDENNSVKQEWILKPAGNDFYYIISACNGLYLNVANESKADGTNVELYTKRENNAQKFKFKKPFVLEVISGTYGSSGLKVKGDWSGQNLRYYKIGTGANIYFATFAVHGFEDGWNNDGQVLTKIAEDFKNKLIEMQDENLSNKWTIYIFPSVNPDGEYHGWSHNGPGRTSLYSAAPNNKGIDINRCWSTGYVSQTKLDRNYNGTEPFQSYEARALRDFLLNKRSSNGQNILVDLHGWLNETIGDEEIGGFYRSKYGMSKHIYTYGQGYLVNWARNNLGNYRRTARSSLVELPEYDQDSSKYINATIEMLRNIN